MKPWLGGLFSALKSAGGSVPKGVRPVIALVGALGVATVTVVFVRQMWDADITEWAIIYAALFLLVYLAMIRSGGQ